LNIKGSNYYKKVLDIISISDASHIKIHILLLAFLYFLIEYEYYSFIVPYFNHLGYSFSFSFSKYFVAKLLFVLSLFSLYYLRTSSFIYIIKFLFILLMLMPALVLYQFHSTSIAYSTSVLVFILALSIPIKLNKLVNLVPVFSEKKLIYTLIIAIILLILPHLLTYGFNFSDKVFSFNLAEHYDVRKEVVEKSNLFIAYTLGPLVKVVLPILIIYGIYSKKYILSIAGVIIMMYLFFINPHKTIVISVFVIMIFYFFKNYYHKASFIIVSIIGAILFFKIISAFYTIMPESLLVRRVLFTPALLADYYFDFFKDNHVMFSHSIFKSIFTYNYELLPPFLIGKTFYGNEATSCNTGFIADAYMNFGYYGIAVFIVLAVFIFKFLESLNINSIWFGLIFLFIFQILNGALLTSLLTHGGIVLFIFAILFMRKNIPINK